MPKFLHRLFALICLATAAHATAIITVVVDTHTLVGHAAAPFYLDFQFTDGSGTGDGNNMVEIHSFDFGLGGSIGSLFETPQGDATGDLSSGITLRDTQFFNSFGQSFNPGDKLTLQVNLPGNVDAAGTPDGFTFSILDSSLFPIPTLAPFLQDFVLAADIDGANPTIQVYGGDISRTPSAGGTVLDFGVQYSSDSVDVPEPAANWEVAVGLLLAVLARIRIRS